MAAARGWAGLGGVITLVAVLTGCSEWSGTPDPQPTVPVVATNAALGDAPPGPGPVAGSASPSGSGSTPGSDSTPGSGSTSGSGSTPGSGSTSGSGSVAASPAVVDEAGFVSPSGNIGCYLDRDGARCDIIRKNWRPPPTPDDCDLDWGAGVSVYKAEEASFTCAGDTVLGGKRTLAYGQALRAGDFLCSSDRKAMRCENSASGHGFTLATEQYHLF